MRLIGGAGLLLTLNFGCAHPVANDKPRSTDCAELASYSQSIEPILEQRCVGCHNPNGEASEHDLRSYAGVHARRRAIAARVSAGIMPPPGAAPLDEANRRELARWAQCGAPRN